MKKHILIFLVFALAFPVLSQEDYADLELRVDEKGIVYFSGSTNYKSFLGESDFFTSKKGPYWLINITTKETFSDYYISMEFPKNTEINYIKTQGSFRITETPALKLITTGEDEPVEIIVQYIILKKEAESENLLILSLGAIVGVVLIILAIVSSKKISKIQKKETKETRKADDKNTLDLIKHTLTENQNLILDILHQSKEPITQKQLQHRTSLPKATLSRNLELLKQKNIIVKQSRGMVNVVFLNDDFRK